MPPNRQGVVPHVTVIRSRNTVAIVASPMPPPRVRVWRCVRGPPQVRREDTRRPRATRAVRECCASVRVDSVFVSYNMCRLT